MTGIPSEEVVDVLGELAQVIDATQILSGVQRNPTLVFEAVKTLAQQSVGKGTATSQLENAYKNILEKERQLDESAKELKATKEELKEYEKSPGTNVVLRKLADVLDRLQLPGQKSAAINIGTVFNGNKRLIVSHLERRDSPEIKLERRPLPIGTIKNDLHLLMLDTDCQAHLHGSIQNGELNFDSVSSMMNELTVLFDDPNWVRDAIARPHSNFQKNKPFSSWVAEIRCDAAIAGYEKSKELRNNIFEYKS